MPAEQEPFSLYVHIPYCISKCPYCDFNSHVVPEIPEANYTEALIQELNHYARMDDWRGRSIQTIFFGGGTPSTFQPSSIARILESADGLFPDRLCLRNYLGSQSRNRGKRELCRLPLLRGESYQRRRAVFPASSAQVSR